MTTKVHYCGSRFAGQKPATLDDLILALQHHPLDPWFRKHGIADQWHDDDGKRWVRIFGNFEDVSHGFSVDTDDPALIQRFAKLEKENRLLRRHPCMGDDAPKDTPRCPCYASHFARFQQEEEEVQP